MTESKQPPVSGATVVATDAGAPPPVQAAPSTPVPTDDLVGTVLADRYRILKRLGEGGMGTVYLAEHTTIRKKLAVKVLAPEYAQKSDLVDRFLQEARAASMISQENVVEITDFDASGGVVFFVMEFLEGEDLSDTVKREGPLPWARVKPIMLQICRALQAAHDRGIIHRDMKPENCYRIKRGKNEDFIKVLDFGIAKVTGDEGGDKGLTRTGMIFGTPEYMSPEQARGERPDHRVDVYAVGVIMYELLTGRVPFTADTFMGILTKHMFEPPPAPTSVNPNADITPEIEAIILKALQKDKELRFQSMDEMAAAIEAVGTGAGPVDVVSENIARPSDGRTEFVGGAASAAIPVGQTGTGEFEVSRSSNRKWVFGGLAAVAVLAIGGFVVANMGGDDGPPVEANDAPAPEPSTPTPPPSPDPQPVQPEPVPTEPTPTVKALDPAKEKVRFKILTPGVDADILDARDLGIYGKTNDPNGVEFEKSEDELKLILRAPGYEDLELSIVPDRDKTYKRRLKKRRTPRPGKKKKGKKQSTVVKPVPLPKTPKKDPKPDKPKPKKVHHTSSDLKDPFGGG
ncbi:MAG: serine/threonine protein kinase [Deltaproteobacteria bacterium]|nr:MAG: serine/threonine protein kinase [Deltaproteobacteria bacterium]